MAAKKEKKPANKPRKSKTAVNTPKAKQQSSLQEIEFHYLKSNFFRVIHADGAWGGLVKSDNLELTFFNERPAIPQRVLYEVTSDGKLNQGEPVFKEGKEGVIREVETCIIMKVDTAREIRKWLDKNIKLADKLTEKQKELTKKKT